MFCTREYIVLNYMELICELLFFVKIFLTLCILVDLSIQTNAIRMEVSIIYFKGSQIKIFK